MTIWTAGAGGVVLFLLGIIAGKHYPAIHLLWLAYTAGLLGLTARWLKHLAGHTENLLLEAPDRELAARRFPVKISEFAKIDRNLARIYRKVQLAEFAILNQKARQAGENFNLMLSNTTDPLTGAPNRRELDRHLEKVAGRMNPLSVIMADIDHFKKVNDTYGHDAGDHVLRQFAETVRASVRPGDFFGRYGGEEFMVICNAGLDEAAEIAERVREAVEKTPVRVPGGGTVSITASFGVARQMPGEDAASVVRRADSALYRAKQEGRNRVAGGGEICCAG
ncbi:MAG: GGDEF domain-containing protein [Peptococcaceae bacterium]|nr:GGDEF domain-containing protein [Peptococcaceae bacterium]